MSQNLLLMGETGKSGSDSGFVFKAEPIGLTKWIGWKMSEQKENQGGVAQATGLVAVLLMKLGMN